MDKKSIAVILVPALLLLVYYFLFIIANLIKNFIETRNNDKKSKNLFLYTTISSPQEDNLDYRIGPSESYWVGLKLAAIFFIIFFILDYIIMNLR